ncbi:solute carrier family 35 member F1-like [Styela clava]
MEERLSDSSGTGNHLCKKIKSFGKHLISREVLVPLLYGQGLSLLICGTAVTSTYLVEDYNADIPCTQSFCNYFLLCIVYGLLLLRQKDENGNRVLFKTLKEFGWKYFLISVADVAANFLMVTAYQYTSLTSVQVLDCFVIFIVMVLSWFILKTRYKAVHYVGVVIALLGVAVMITADVLLDRGGEGSGSNPLLGDMMVLLGATCYGISNVGMEFVMKTRPVGRTEILAMFGIFGSITTGILIAALERDALKAVIWSAGSIMSLVGFAACMFALYSLMPIVMKMSSAATVNLSVLTADLYALFAGIFLFGYKFTPLYIISFFVIFLSLLIYNSKPPGSLVVQNSSAIETSDNAEGGVLPTSCNNISTTSFSSTNSSTKPLCSAISDATDDF